MSRMALAATALTVALSVIAPLVEATQASHNLDAKWKKCIIASYDHFVQWRWIGTTIPGSTTTNTANAAAGIWSAVGREFIFSRYSGTSTPPCPVDVRFAKLGWPNENKWAIETNYKFGMNLTISSASITFNNPPPFGVTWNLDQGTPLSNEIDFFTVAAHEFGHAVALNHSECTPTFTICGSDIMYYGISAGPTGVKRVLTTHDKSSISWLYPIHQ